MSSKTDNSTKTATGSGSNKLAWGSMKRHHRSKSTTSLSAVSSKWQKQISFKVKGTSDSKEDQPQQSEPSSKLQKSNSDSSSSSNGKGMAREVDSKSSNNKNVKPQSEGSGGQLLAGISQIFLTANAVDKMSHSMHGTGNKKRQQQIIHRHSTHGMPSPTSKTSSEETKTTTGSSEVKGKPPMSPQKVSRKKETEDKVAPEPSKQTSSSNSDNTHRTLSQRMEKSKQQLQSAPIKLITQLQMQNRAQERTNAALNEQIKILKAKLESEQTEHKSAVEQLTNENEEVNLKLSVLEKHFCALNSTTEENGDEDNNVTAVSSPSSPSQHQQQEQASNNTAGKFSLPPTPPPSSQLNQQISKSIVQLDAAYVADLKKTASASTSRLSELENELAELKKRSSEEQSTLREEIEDLSTRLSCREETVNNLERNLEQLREARLNGGGSVAGGSVSSGYNHHRRRHRRAQSTNSAIRSPRYHGGGVSASGSHDHDDDASVVSHTESVFSVGDSSVISNFSHLPAPTFTRSTAIYNCNTSPTGGGAISEEEIAKAVTEAVKTAIAKRDEEFKGKVERLRERTKQRLATRESKIAKLERKVIDMQKSLKESQKQLKQQQQQQQYNSQADGESIMGGASTTSGPAIFGGSVSATVTLATNERQMLLNLRALSVTSEMMDGSIHRLENIMKIFSARAAMKQQENDKIMNNPEEDEKDDVLTLAQKLSLLQEELRVSIQLLDQRTKNRLEALRDAAVEEEKIKHKLQEKKEKEEEEFIASMKETAAVEDEEENKDGSGMIESKSTAESGQSSGEGAEQEQNSATSEHANNTADAAKQEENEQLEQTKKAQRQLQQQQEMIEYQQSIADLINEVHREVKTSLRDIESHISKQLNVLQEQVRVNEFDLDAKRDIIESLEQACAENDRNVRRLTLELSEAKEKESERRKEEEEKEKDENKNNEVKEENKKKKGTGKKEKSDLKQGEIPPKQDRSERRKKIEEEVNKKVGGHYRRQSNGSEMSGWGRVSSGINKTEK
mmetsp:Transcript_6420/g.8623  ORF Transcript_6420/g.8623 Transcript_6420/m.8623 type:complete len:1020 (-) Transcript_6420:197-3256(-)